jgi:hypothetical protein
MLQNLSEHIRESKRMAQVLFWILIKKRQRTETFLVIFACKRNIDLD